MSVDRRSAFGQEALISEAFSALACADTDVERPYVRAYVADELVLTVTERKPGSRAPHDRPSRRLSAVGTLGALQRRTTVEEVTGRHVTAALSGRLAEPDLDVELFVLAPALRTRDFGPGAGRVAPRRRYAFGRLDDAMKPPETAGTTRATRIDSPPAHGDYLCSDSELYCVEQVGPERVVLEDCRTGMLLDLSLTDISKLRPVTPAPSSA